MTDTNNGWPGKPGVPLNSGLPGAHWLKGYTEDAWMYDGDGGWWGPGYSHNLDAGTVAARYSYLGPCLTPDEATALQARVTELERLADLADSWITAALECKDWRWDADQHKAATHTRDELRAALEGKKE